MHLRIHGATDVGCVRQRNDDTYIVDPDLGLAVVADGIGGMHRGDIAASIACRVVREQLRRHRRDLEAFIADPASYKRDRVEDRLREAVQAANTEVFAAGEALSPGRGMGCTLEAALVLGRTAFVAHVGDARTYFVRAGHARQITEDHSVVAEKVRRGVMTAEQAKVAPSRNLITRAVGNLPTLRVDTMVMSFAEGDRLVLVSDGVTRYIEDAELGVLCHSGDPACPGDVVGLARSRGGADNITTVVVAGHPDLALPIAAVDLDELRRSWLLEGLTGRELRRVAEVVEKRTVKSGRVLFREGTIGDELFIVLEGQVTITSGGRTLATCGPGDVLGEVALLDPPARSATALVTLPARLAVISRHGFEQLLREDEGVASRILWALAHRLSHVVRDQNARLRPVDPAATGKA